MPEEIIAVLHTPTRCIYVDSNTTKYCVVSGPNRVNKAYNEINVGEKIFVRNTGKHTLLEEVEDKLHWGPAYIHARDSLFCQNKSGKYIPQLRNLLIKGLYEQEKAGSFASKIFSDESESSLEDKILKNPSNNGRAHENDFDSKTYEEMISRVQDILKDYDVKPDRVSKWLRGEVIAISKGDWEMYTALGNKLNSKLSRFNPEDDSKSGINYQYWLYREIRKSASKKLQEGLPAEDTDDEIRAVKKYKKTAWDTDLISQEVDISLGGIDTAEIVKAHRAEPILKVDITAKTGRTEYPKDRIGSAKVASDDDKIENVTFRRLSQELLFLEEMMRITGKISMDPAYTEKLFKMPVDDFMYLIRHVTFPQDYTAMPNCHQKRLLEDSTIKKGLDNFVADVISGYADFHVGLPEGTIYKIIKSDRDVRLGLPRDFHTYRRMFLKAASEHEAIRTGAYKIPKQFKDELKADKKLREKAESLKKSLSEKGFIFQSMNPFSLPWIVQLEETYFFEKATLVMDKYGLEPCKILIPKIDFINSTTNIPDEIVKAVLYEGFDLPIADIKKRIECFKLMPQDWPEIYKKDDYDYILKELDKKVKALAERKANGTYTDLTCLLRNGEQK